MVWGVVVLTVAVVLALVLAAESGCTNVEIQSGLCLIDASLRDDRAVLEGNASSPGGGGGGTEYEDGQYGDPESPLSLCDYILNDKCMRRAERPSRAVPSVSLSDLVEFRPSAGIDSMEPNGWAVIGLPTNFYATSVSEVQGGTLLGQPAWVRFTPVRWHWSYGDGADHSSATAGASWSALGIPEFGQTPTSHVFTAAGEYSILLTIDYGAEYRVASPEWTPITGTLPVAADPLGVSVGHANTVLVLRDCAAQLGGLGC